MIPYAVTGTNSQRLAAEERGRTSVTEANNFSESGTSTLTSLRLQTGVFTITSELLSVAVRKAALAAVDADLQQEGLLDQNGNLNPDAVKQFSWQKDICLPTPGVLVKGCLDTCSICEPEVEQKIQLELQRMDLENKLLQKKIDLLDKAQEYRCCPGDPPTPAQA